jgi:hypothetical protein
VYIVLESLIRLLGCKDGAYPRKCFTRGRLPWPDWLGRKASCYALKGREKTLETTDKYHVTQKPIRAGRINSEGCSNIVLAFRAYFADAIICGFYGLNNLASFESSKKEFSK